jgi:DnaJ-class molecular chaperone
MENTEQASLVAEHIKEHGMHWPLKSVFDFRICKRCGGAGNLLRSTENKLINYVKCSSCNGRGTRNKEIK